MTFEEKMSGNAEVVLRGFLSGEMNPKDFITGWNTLYYLLVHEWHTRGYHEKWEVESWEGNTPSIGG